VTVKGHYTEDFIEQGMKLHAGVDWSCWGLSVVCKHEKWGPWLFLIALGPFFVSYDNQDDFDVYVKNQ
jgi:hypothetical protein